MSNMDKRIRHNMSKNVIGGLTALMLLFGLIVCAIGIGCIIRAFKNEYSTVTYHMADSVATFVNGDNIDLYLSGGGGEEYNKTKNNLDIACRKLNVSLIYVIKVDTDDYGRFVSVFNSVNNSVDDSEYSEWELGHKRDTTNDEYRRKYREVYEQGAEYETVFRLHTNDGSHPHITTLVPVKNSSGEVTAILCMQRPIREIGNTIKPYLLLIILGAVIWAIVISLIAAAFLKRSIIRPVENVSAESTRFAKEHTKGEPIGELSRYDTILDLAGSIETMESDIMNYIENQNKYTAEKEHIRTELSVASTIQNDALPDTFPAFPERNEFDIYAVMDPAKEVGGDFYNFYLTDDDHLALVIADVSGKGIPASLFMMQANTLINGRLQIGGTPSETLSFVNDYICGHNRADMFVTVFLGILEISTGKLIYANAGHEYPAVYRKDTGFEIVKEKHGFVLGGMEGMRFTDLELQLESGDKLFLYTDGAPEATDNDGNMYTVDRLIKALNDNRDKNVEAIIDGVRTSINNFVGDAPQFDDLTMLCLEYVSSD